MPKSKRKPVTRNQKLWGGRFAKQSLPLVEKFTQSYSFDRRLLAYDLQANIAHVKMLKHCKIIPPKNADRLLKALHQLLKDGGKTLPKQCEDVHTAVELALKKRIGDDASYLGTARSRNDLVATITRLYVKDEIKLILKKIDALIGAFTQKQKHYADVVMPGFTHLQPAQKVKASVYFGAYVEMLKRDRKRFSEALERCDEMPLGSGALAGTSLPVDRGLTRKLLGFKKTAPNTMDAVADRDFILDFLYTCAVMSMHLSRFAEDLILWVNPFFNFAALPDEFCTGSSLLPQKKNPDILELVRGKSGRVYGNLLGVLVMMKGLPLTYNRDMQEDKERLFDTNDTVQNVLDVLNEMVLHIALNTKRLESAVKEGYLEALDAAEYLVMQGVPFRRAHEITGKMVQYLEKHKKRFSDLTLDEMNVIFPEGEKFLLSRKIKRSIFKG